MMRAVSLARNLAVACGVMAFLAPAMPAQTAPALPSDGLATVGSKITTVTEDKNTPCEPGKTSLVDQPPEAVALLGIKKAWQLSRGKVVVAVVDSGVAASNVHLTDKVLPGADLVESGDGRTDTAGHGTAIAGQIAAHEAEGSGLVGLAPAAEILPVRVYVDESNDSVKAGKQPDTTRTAAGVRWAAEHGAKIIVVAQSVIDNLPEMQSAVEYAAAAGALVVASAGNVPQETNASPKEDPNAPRYPAAYPQALSVTAVDASGAPSDAVLHGEHVEVAAPGSRVLTTFLGDGDCILAGDKPSTSYATGYVAAAAAMVAAMHPGETPAEWKYRLLATALRPSRSQRDAKIGWGLIAPYDALNFSNDGSLEGPPNPRFSAPAKPENPGMTPPESVPDLRPMRTISLGIIAGTACLVVLAVLLSSRVRDLLSRKSR